MNEQFNNYGQNPYNNPYYNNQQPKKPAWASVVSFVLSIVNVVACCCMTYVFAPLSIIFGIVSLAKKWAGKGLAVAGIVISSVTLVIAIVSSVLMNTIFKEPYEDMMKFVINADYYIEEYQETKEVPDDFKKYCDPKYDRWWEYMDYDDFEDFYEEFMEDFISNYKSYGGNYNNDYNDSYNNDYNDSYDYDNFGERPVEL